MTEVTLPQGTVRYRDIGEGEPVLFVHGLLVDGRLWDGVLQDLPAGMRCLIPDLPLGAHTTAMNAGADLAPPAIADLLAAFLDALGLDEVIVVGHDTGGAISQMFTARHPHRVKRLLLTPCDTYDNFLPPIFRYLQVMARIPGAITVLAQSLRIKPLHRLPIAFGWLVKRPADPALLDSWLGAARRDPGVRRDLGKVLRGIRKRDLLEAAETLKGFDRPVLLAFAPEDKLFKIADAERMAREWPDVRLERIEDSYAFAPLDQPKRVAELVGGFVPRQV